jgi:hypothetical protein
MEKEELKHIGRILKKPGCTIFCYNPETGEISEVHGNKIVTEKGCIYMQALNKKNFVRKLVRRGLIVNLK